MVQIYKDLSDKGFQILAFPCNQFGGQEPGTPQEIDDFARKKYGSEFPIFEKIEVNGGNTHDVYQFLRTHSNDMNDANINQAKVIPWNFAKFLVDRNGHVQKYYAPTVSPNDIRPDIEEMMK